MESANSASLTIKTCRVEPTLEESILVLRGAGGKRCNPCYAFADLVCQTSVCAVARPVCVPVRARLSDRGAKRPKKI